MSDSLVSIVIAVFNVKDYISHCLYTIVNQTYRNLEIIVVDDGSTDGSGVICEEFAQNDDRIRIIHQNNQGVAAARNNGKKVATGKFIMFIDGDDYLHLESVKTLYEIISHDETCGIAMFDFVRTPSLDEDIVTSGVKQNRIESLTQSQAISLLLSTNSLALTFMWNKLYRTEVIREIDNRSYKTADDLDFNLRVFLTIDKIEWIHRPLYYYVQRPGSITKSSSSLFVPENVVKVIADNLLALDGTSHQYHAYLLSKLFRKLAEISGRAWIANEYSSVLPFISEYRAIFQKDFMRHPRISVLEKLGVSCLLRFPYFAAIVLKCTHNV